YWGTPIAMFYCDKCKEPLKDKAVFKHVEELFRKHGSSVWFEKDAKNILPTDAKCGKCQNTSFRKEEDILDVWFDSGVSWAAVLRDRMGHAERKNVMYLEGSDQHRGWFQVSLIPSAALRHQPPYQQVLTHGFVMDGEGRKMSKSLGNVIAPQDVMARYGADILRLWVASCDYREDVRISEEILSQTAETYRKIRNTFRYLLSNLSDFNPGRDGTPTPESFPELDRWASERARQVWEQVTAAYEAYQFHEVLRTTYQYCVLDLSGFYLDALKDRLYTEASASLKRRCAQTTLYAILHLLVKALAPILAVTTEEVWQTMRKAQWVSEPSVHLASWPQAPDAGLDEAGRQRWAAFRAIRDVVMKALEEERIKRIIGSPLEAQVTLVVDDPGLRQLCETHRETLAEAFVVSRVNVQTNGTTAASGRAVPGLVDVKVERAPGGKCERCWKHLTSVGAQPEHPQLCERCVSVVSTPTKDTPWP
ncbi:MAG: class I tRNA ligase family protein, partial [Candidatus Omnitrophica bacterium]|nr:class I tRNA ligase family protein [Candidatus Omnitrophota bacterium]